jgi:N-acetylneuraminate synthase
VPSGEVTNGPLLLDFARKKRRMIVSTGMSSLGDIENCLSVLAFGLINKKGVEPGVNQFRAAYFSADGQRMLQEYVSLLHCTTEYPAPFDDINLAAMDSMRSAFGLPVGYSDHSTGIEVSVAAVARGAMIIEKHFTLDRAMEGPDHKASLEPQELSLLVSSVRNIERAIGDGLKGPRPSEIKNIVIARKSLVAKTAIKKGEIITADMLIIKRPGSGQSPMNYWNFVGSVALKEYRADEVIV